MKATRSHRETVFGPQQRKSFRSALALELSKHVPTLGALTAQALAQHLEGLVQQYFPPTQRLRMGQVLWPAVAKNETGAYGKRIEQTQLKPVLLTLFDDQDLADYLRGMAKARICQKVAIRLFEQAHEQGGVLTRTDVATLLRKDPKTISKYVRDYECKTQRTVPRRGTIHDIGPSVTHKREICYRVIVQGRSIEETARETHHSPEAVTRYVKAYRRVFFCLQNGFSIDQTAFATKLSKSLVKQYAEIQAEHDQLRPPALDTP